MIIQGGFRWLMIQGLQIRYFTSSDHTGRDKHNLQSDSVTGKS